MSTHHDEHGDVDAGYQHEQGPEWWAMGAELCTCNHRADLHREASEGGRFPCTASEGGIGWSNACACQDFMPALDNQ